ncbi:hypothetical protein [Actinoplanes flavus]|uniref:Uncharacterized protein n=1 Tax=Actinoplanes flavus TaxID=2820290 RepID=A0ABS3UC97_9ACTN|nr:hypothetical protein [Actinoplanes flavus]MBO3736404.1 hypothetical protein [Actinoplanes flavus]
MTDTWRHLPAPARPIAAAATTAVAAVRAKDTTALDDAVTALAALDPARSGLVLGTAVRLLLEDGHPDGLTADDVRAALASCVRSWPEQADPQVVLWLLAAALGVLDEDGTPPPGPGALARNAAVLLADLLAGRPLAPWWAATLAEIERAQLND